MNKKRYFIQISLENFDSLSYYSDSKERVLSFYESFRKLFEGKISLTSSNFELKH